MIRSIVQFLKNRYLSRYVIFVMDVALSILASILTLVVSDIILGHFQVFPFEEPHLKFFYIIIAAAASCIAFYLMHINRIVIRRLVVRDLGSFGLASLIKGVLMLIVAFFTGRLQKSVLLILGIDVFITSTALIVVRLVMILVWNHFNRRIQEKYKYKRVMVYGTSDKSIATLVRLENSPHYKVIGFLDKGDEDRMISGLKVFSDKDDSNTEKILLDNRIDALLFATDKEAQAEENRLIHFCALKGIQCLVVPTVDEVVEGEAILLRLYSLGRICASSGSACTTGSLEPSHVLRAMGLDYQALHGSVRFSLSRYNTEDEIDRLLEIVPTVIRSLRALSPFGR